jgi:hypothetical protein
MIPTFLEKKVISETVLFETAPLLPKSAQRRLRRRRGGKTQSLEEAREKIQLGSFSKI